MFLSFLTSYDVVTDDWTTNTTSVDSTLAPLDFLQPSHVLHAIDLPLHWDAVPDLVSFSTAPTVVTDDEMGPAFVLHTPIGSHHTIMDASLYWDTVVDDDGSTISAL